MNEAPHEEVIAQDQKEQSSIDHSRRVVRTIIFQMLYALDSFEYSITPEELASRFNEELDQAISLNGEIVAVVTSIVEEKDELDAFLVPLFSNWRPDRVGCCTRLILRMAIWEMKNTTIPSSIIINEAIELAKNFSEKDAHRFVNGVLDQAVKKLNPVK